MIEIPKRPWISKWDGYYKDYTKDCSDCRWYRKIKDNELCGWGIAFKYLIRHKEKLKGCGLVNKKRRGKHSVEYLDQLIKTN